MELGIILRHDPLTLGSGYDKKVELRGAFVQSSSRTVRGKGRMDWKSDQADMEQRWGSLKAVWLLLDQMNNWTALSYFFLQFFIYQMKALIRACITQKESAKTVQNCPSYASTKFQRPGTIVMSQWWWYSKCGNPSTATAIMNTTHHPLMSHIRSYPLYNPNTLFITQIDSELTELWLNYCSLSLLGVGMLSQISQLTAVRPVS